MNEIETIKCACNSHLLVLDGADWDCQGNDALVTLDITMWETVPQRFKTPWYKDLFYLPRYTWKLQELWKTWKGDRYAEWVVLDRDATERLRDYLTDLLAKG